MRVIVGIDRRLVQNLDWLLLAAAGALIGLGMLSMWSLTAGGASPGILSRQLWWVGVGTVALVVVASLDYRNLVRAAPAFYLVGLALLLTVFVLGRTVSGARRWIHIGSFTFQPSELFKIIFVLALAWALTSRWARPLSRSALDRTALSWGCPSRSSCGSPTWAPRWSCSPCSPPSSWGAASGCARSAASSRWARSRSCRSRGSS